MKIRSILPAVGLLVALLPSTLYAQSVSFTADGGWGDYKNVMGKVCTLLPFGESGWGTDIRAGYGYEDYEDLDWIDSTARDEVGRVYRFEGETLLNGSLGKFRSVLSVKGGLTGAEPGLAQAGDPYFSAYVGVMFPFGKKVRLMPIISYAAGGKYPIPTAMIFWNISDRLMLDAKLISPRMNLSYSFNKRHLLRGGVEFDQENVSFDKGRDFFYRRLVSRLEYQWSFSSHLVLTAYGEGAFLQSSEFERSDDASKIKIKDESVDPDLRLGLRFKASY